MALTFKNLQDRAIILGNYGEADRTNLKEMMNTSYYDVCRRRRWTWLEVTTSISTVAGVATVAIPTAASAYSFGRLRPTSTMVWPPEYIDDFGDFDPLTRLAIDTLERGEPTFFTMSGANFTFYPTPDAVYQYTVHYWFVPVLLSADADNAVIPDMFRDVIISGALMLHAARDKDPAMYQFYQNQYEGQIEEMRKRDLSRQFQTPSRASMGPAYGRQYDETIWH